VLLTTLQPDNLIIEERILKLIPPRAPGHNQTNDLFNGYTGGLFDPLAANHSTSSQVRAIAYMKLIELPHILLFCAMHDPHLDIHFQ